MANRREFIKIAGLGPGGLALGNPVINAFNNTFLQDDAKLLAGGLTRTPVCCEVCFWKCAG